jgi:L-alanine-DL-glutamate epimerase-like enolase superfamily enzyme
MKIVKAETILLAIPFESGGLAPWGWGGSPANTFDVLLVRLETEDGVVGWGEAFSRMEDRALKQMIDDRVLPLVLGRDAKEISRIKHDLEFNLHNFGRIGPIMYGISAVDIALWDLAGKTSGRPLVDLLGGAQSPSDMSRIGYLLLLTQLVEQRLRLSQVGRVEAFGKPAVDRCEEMAGLITPALIAPQPGEAARRAQFE